MINGIKIFDCTLREAGYQTGWFFDEDFCRDYYAFAAKNKIDYLELGFFHDVEADPGRGDLRYCGLRNERLKEIFMESKKIWSGKTKLSAMRDIQRPLTTIPRQEESVVDAIRILTRSIETDLTILEQHIKEIQELGYEVFINFTSSGSNTIEQNIKFAQFAQSLGVRVIYFADTESIFTDSYVENTLKLCQGLNNVNVGMHLHNKNGKVEELLDVALNNHCRYIDVTLMGLGGKWHDGNLPLEYFFAKNLHNPGYEQTKLKTQLIQNLIKYHKYSAAILS
ncbi:pyruvate carboxyltransferase [Helicobacter sp. faydin-H17]|nr:pyruvate carboxyltransferase [Helicobacter kayseriensis]MCE3046689.1 pyruvate carboxyltransferase [Helicobacter kayseriensis]